MRPIAPRIEGAGLEVTEIAMAENQLEYKPLVAAIVDYQNGETERVCRWTFTPDERQRIANGEDVYFGTPASIPLVPHWLAVGFDA